MAYSISVGPAAVLVASTSLHLEATGIVVVAGVQVKATHYSKVDALQQELVVNLNL
jgi:hypothetical protein